MAGRDFARMPARRKALWVFLFLAAGPVLAVAEEVKNYVSNNTFTFTTFPAYVHTFFYNYLPKQWPAIPVRLLLDYFGLAGVVAMARWVMLRGEGQRRPWDAAAEAEFRDPEAIILTLSDLAGRLPLALLLDNARGLKPLEMIAINRILAHGPEVPASLRVLFVALDLPRGRLLGAARQETFEVPELSEDLQLRSRAIREQIAQEVAARMGEDEAIARPGALGAFEWTAYEAVLDRRSVPTAELASRYAALTSCGLLPLLGLDGPHPAKPPDDAATAAQRLRRVRL